MRLTRKGYADESLLQHPMLQSQLLHSTSNDLAEAGITSYSKLLEVTTDNSIEADIRAKAIGTVHTVLDALDKRYILTPLLKALDSPNEKVRSAVIHSLSQFKYPKIILLLVNLVCDKQESFGIRLSAMQSLYNDIGAEQFDRLRAVIFDKTDDIRVRCEVLEWLSYPSDFNEVDDFIQLLQHNSPDLRFWAAYRLTQSHSDISQAVTALDKVAAFDHHLPATWGWHVDREALMALEGIYWRKFFPRRHYWPHPPMYLISPAPEYDTFVRKYRMHYPDWIYRNLPTPTIDMKIDPIWLKERLLEQWPNAEIDIRDPKPKTYILDWKIKIGRQTLIGGLHRDQYGVVLAGNQKPILKFATWYRSIISNDQPLFLYSWADAGYELKQGMSTQDIQVGLKSVYNFI